MPLKDNLEQSPTIEFISYYDFVLVVCGNLVLVHIVTDLLHIVYM